MKKLPNFESVLRKKVIKFHRDLRDKENSFRSLDLKELDRKYLISKILKRDLKNK